MGAPRGFGAAEDFGVVQAGRGLTDLTLELGKQSGLSARGVGGRVFLGPSGQGGDARALTALFRGECYTSSSWNMARI